MKFRKAAQQLDGIPHISKRPARILYDFILARRPLRCLELGFAHGASSGDIAVALVDELGHGHLTASILEPDGLSGLQIGFLGPRLHSAFDD